MRTRLISGAFVAAVVLLVASVAFGADDRGWRVQKFLGEVWTAAGDVQQASLKAHDLLMPGQAIRPDEMAAFCWCEAKRVS